MVGTASSKARDFAEGFFPEGGVTSWVHSATEHLAPEKVARLHLDFQERYSWDVVKIMSDYRPLTVFDRHLLAVPDEATLWFAECLNKLNPAIQAQLEVLRVLRDSLPQTPLMETVFTPYQLLVRTVGQTYADLLRSQLPEQTLAFLQKVTDRQIEHLLAAEAAGIELLFLSTNTFGKATDRWVEPFDEQLLRATDMLSVAHLHGPTVTGIINPHCYEGASVLSVCYEVPPADLKALPHEPALMGGFNEHNTLYINEAEIQSELATYWESHSNQAFLLAPGCTVHSDTPARVLDAYASSVI